MDLPAQTDVVIVGAGFAGCATAWALAAHGVQAIVLEREPELGRQASGRGAGLGRQLVEDDATTQLVIRGAAALRGQLAAAWDPTGGVLSFDDPAHAQAYVSRAQRFGIAHEVIDRAGVLARWPAMTGLSIAAAIYVPSDGVIDVRALLAAFAARATIACGVAVVGIAHDAVGARIDTTRGTLRARVVVDAAGAWAGMLTGDEPLESYKRHLFVLEAAARASTPYLWHLGREELYLRQVGGGMLASPCDALATAAIDQQAEPDGDDRLRARLSPAAPAWSPAIVRRWACQRAFTADRQMRVGRDPRRPWLVWAAALGGHGATASPAVGELAAAAVMEAL